MSGERKGREREARREGGRGREDGEGREENVEKGMQRNNDFEWLDLKVVWG